MYEEEEVEIEAWKHGRKQVRRRGEEGRGGEEGGEGEGWAQIVSDCMYVFVLQKHADITFYPIEFSNITVFLFLFVSLIFVRPEIFPIF